MSKVERRIVCSAVFLKRVDAYIWPIMFKPTAIIVATALFATSAFAQQAPSGAQRSEVRADLDKARATGAWPVRESNDVQRYTVAGGGRKVQRRPRKEYPNVMRMSILARELQEGPLT